MTDLQGKTAIVTGASRGIGRTVAAALAAHGVHVMLAARSGSQLSEVRQQIVSAGGIASVHITDVTDEASVEGMVHETLRQFGTVDMLINNAGVGIFAPVATMTSAQFDLMMNANLRGVFLCSRAVLPVMKRQQSGDIITIASLAGKNSFVGGAVYSASKWGVIGFSRSLMLEVRDDHIRVITLAPGSVNTGFGDKERNDATIIQPQDVAETVLFALSMPAHVNVSEIDIRPTTLQRK